MSQDIKIDMYLPAKNACRSTDTCLNILRDQELFHTKSSYAFTHPIVLLKRNMCHLQVNDAFVLLGICITQIRIDFFFLNLCLVPILSDSKRRKMCVNLTLAFHEYLPSQCVRIPDTNSNANACLLTKICAGEGTLTCRHKRIALIQIQNT